MAETSPSSFSPTRYRRQGEPFVWISGGMMALGMAMIIGLVVLIVAEGTSTFWPRKVEKFTLGDGSVLVGSVEADRPLDIRDLPLQKDGTPWEADELPDPAPQEWLVRQGNQDENLYERDKFFVWVKGDVPEIDEFERRNPFSYSSVVTKREDVTDEVVLIERLEKGVLTGFVDSVTRKDEVLASIESQDADQVWEVFQSELETMQALYEERVELEQGELGDLNWQLTERANEVRELAYEHRESRHTQIVVDSLNQAYEGWTQLKPFAPTDTEADALEKMLRNWLGLFEEKIREARSVGKRFDLNEEQNETLDDIVSLMFERAEIEAIEYSQVFFRVQQLREQEEETLFTLRTHDGKQADFALAHVVRAFQPNKLGFFGKLEVYFDRVWEFLTAEPREANSEGGILKVIIGTLIMTMMMALVVVPFGVITALYLREYAKQGMIVSAVRVAVNNLAGVPSIVFGIFGLGFFCVVVGGTIDEIFFPEMLPSPTFGGGGILWASLTLALLTVPVVVVATEEALASVPSSQREASLGAGASKFQTIARVVIPQSMPGILTGAILAMARGAGEVAPLMLVGVVKSAPYIPVDGNSPFIHLERKFMHLGFHVYDLGFQSPDVDKTKPLVFSTALVLLVLVGVMNIFAIRVRSRLRRKLATSHV